MKPIISQNLLNVLKNKIIPIPKPIAKKIRLGIEPENLSFK